MKIAVYAICKNEEDNIDRFIDSVKDADYIVVLDTGSSDESVLRLRRRLDFISECKIEPWRFDVARNKAMSLIPADADVCISMDLDEILLPGWRHQIEKNWVIGNNRLFHWYEEEDCGYRYRHHKGHSRQGWHWKHAVHEELIIDGVENKCMTDMVMQHWPDRSKSRSQYLELLKIVMRESPNNVRARLYCVTENMRAGNYHQAIEMVKKTIDMIEWHIERSYFCMLAAECYSRVKFLEGESLWRHRAIVYAPDWRESWYQLAKFCYDTGDYEAAYRCAIKALSLHERHLVNYSNNEAWGAQPYLIAALAAEKRGMLKEAETNLNRGARSYPNDEDIAIALGDFLSRHK